MRHLHTSCFSTHSMDYFFTMATVTKTFLEIPRRESAAWIWTYGAGFLSAVLTLGAWVCIMNAPGHGGSVWEAVINTETREEWKKRSSLGQIPLVERECLITLVLSSTQGFSAAWFIFREIPACGQQMSLISFLTEEKKWTSAFVVDADAFCLLQLLLLTRGKWPGLLHIR